MPATAAPLRPLTGLRFAAAAAVALSHLWYVAEHPAVPKFVRRLVGEGPAGVSFFFVLSGFILAYNYRDRFPALTRGRLLPYAAARVGRVWPAHLVVLALAVAFPYLPGDAGPPDATKLLAHVFLVQGWVPDPAFAAAFNAVAWTLSVEALFYLCLPGMLWLAARFPGATPRQLLAAAGVVWLAELGYAAALAGRTDFAGVWLAGLFPPGRLFEFAVGVLLGLAFAGRPADGPGTRARGTLEEVAAVAGLLLLAGFAGKVPPLVRANGYYTAVMAAVVWTFARQRGRLSGLFASRPAVFLGEVSFAFYLLHCLVFFHTHRLVGPDRLGLAGLAAASVLLTLAGATAVFYGVEQPARRRVVGWAKRPVTGRRLSPDPAGSAAARLWAAARAASPTRRTPGSAG